MLTAMEDPVAADDERWMEEAIAEARKAIGLTSPNPPVGAVIVGNGEVIGRGWHRRAGAPHAEAEAISAVGSREALRGATLYVTLEPCSTRGRTPPCCEAIALSGISRVVYGSRDPNPEHRGRADQLLQARGVSVIAGVRERETGALIRAFAKFITTGMPWVVAKAAASWDGRISRPDGESRWLTGQAAREDAHRLRADADAIIVGGATVRADDPALTIRGPAARPEKIQPWRVVVTRSGNIPPNAQVLRDAYANRTLIFESEPPERILSDLAGRGCCSVLVEGGGGILGRFFEAGLVDEAVVYLAPLWCGAGAVPLSGQTAVDVSIEFDEAEYQSVGRDLRIRGRVRKERDRPAGLRPD